jgi:hypothetical protein
MSNVRRWCAVLGPAILLVAWLAQQFLFDRWNGQLNRLGAAEAVWENYRSTHYVFNALRPKRIPPDENIETNQVLRWQVRNVDVGMGRLERIIAKDTLRKARAEVLDEQDGGFGGADGAMDLRFKTLERALSWERDFLVQKKERAQLVFWFLYLSGAIITLFGTILREASDGRTKTGQDNAAPAVPGSAMRSPP